MANGVDEVRYYELFKKTLLEAIDGQMEVLRTLFKMDDVVTNAAERFLSIATSNRWDSSDLEAYLLPYVMRAKCGLDRIIDEEDSWVGLHRDTDRNPTVMEAPTLFLHDVVHWRERTKLINRDILIDFLADYPYVLSGRSDINKPESTNISDLLVMRGLITDEYMRIKDIVGMYTHDQVKENIPKILG